MPEVGISGASGFIASRLINLLKGSNRIVAFSRKKDFPEGIEAREYNGGEIDCDGIDVLVHTAASNSEIDALEVNVPEMRRVADSCRKYRIKRLVFLSSYAVYGDRETPAKEEDALHPSGNYGKSKALCEGEARELAENGSCKVTIIRPSSVFGEGASRGAVNKFAELIRNGERITSQNGQDRRQYIYVGDLARFIQKLIREPQEKKLEVYNVSADGTLSTIELVEGIGRKVGKAPVFVDEKTRPPESFMADNSKAKANGLKITIGALDWV